VLQLVPPVCRDCGRSERKARLSPYLDFLLCGDCIARREREVMGTGRPRRKPARKKSPGKKAGAKRRKPRR
jgi:hypothetical protein